MCDHHVTRRHGDAAAFFDVETLDHTVVDDCGVTLRARSEAETRTIEFESHGLGESTRAVGQHKNLVGTLITLPRIHDPWVVDTDARNGLNALRLQLVEPLDESGQVHLRATGCERPGNREQDDLSLAQHFGRAHGLGHTIVTKDVDLDIGDLVSY